MGSTDRGQPAARLTLCGGLASVCGSSVHLWVEEGLDNPKVDFIKHFDL